MEGLYHMHLLHLVGLLHHMDLLRHTTTLIALRIGRRLPMRPLHRINPLLPLTEQSCIDLLQHTALRPQDRLLLKEQLSLTGHHHRMGLACAAHRTLELALIQRRALTLTDRLAHMALLHHREHRIVWRRIVRAQLILVPTTRLLLPVEQALLTVPLHLVDLHPLMKHRGRRRRIQLHLADQLQLMRPMYHTDLLQLTLMGQIHLTDLPQLMGLVQDQRLPIQPHH